MPRWMALDIGQKRTGIAVTDMANLIATPIGYMATRELKIFLQQYFRDEKVDRVVVGWPLQMNHNDSESVKYIEPRVNELKKLYPDIEFIYYDERFTSKMAFDAMIAGGLGQKKRREKGLVDQISAVLILQSYMDNLKYRAQ